MLPKRVLSMSCTPWRKKCCQPHKNTATMGGTDLTLQVMVSPRRPSPSQDSTRQTSTFYRTGGGGSQSRHHSACKRQQNEQFDVTSSRRQYPTVPATSCRGIDARFDRDTGYVVINVSLLRRCIAMHGRGCRPPHVDIQQNKSTRSCNALASTASPNAPISLPLARGHQLLDGQCLKQAHRWGGGCVCSRREVIIILLFIIFYSMLTPYPPSSLVLSTSTTGRLMIASRARRRSCSRGWWWLQACGGKLGGAATTTSREQRKA